MGNPAKNRADGTDGSIASTSVKSSFLAKARGVAHHCSGLATCLVGDRNGSCGLTHSSLLIRLGRLRSKRRTASLSFGSIPVLAGQAFDVIPIGLLGVAIDQSAQRGVGFHHRGVHPQMLAPHQPMGLERRQNQNEDLLVNLRPQPLANLGETRMLRASSRSAQTQETPAPPSSRRSTLSDGPFTGQILKKADHQHLQIHHRVDAGLSHSALVVGRSDNGSIAD